MTKNQIQMANSMTNAELKILDYLDFDIWIL